MMLLKVKGLKVAPRLEIYEVTDDPPKDDPWEEARPKHLIALGEADWPKAVKDDIARQFKRIGVENPYRQKLVEPFAYVFGGKSDDGAYDLSSVNWEMVIDYFRWESAAWDRGVDEAKTQSLDVMIAEIKTKYGGMFNHQMVYERR
jgi:hypothetical protein